MRLAVIVLMIGLSGCAAVSPHVSSGPSGLDAHLSSAERRNLELVQQLHAPGLGLIQRLRDSGLLADDAEWWVAGPPEVLPFAGTWRGLEGVAEFQRLLGEVMDYTKVELQEYIVSGENVAAIFFGEGTGRKSGRPFRSDIVRLYTFRNGKIVRVRNYYDTASYVAAVRPQ